MTDTNPLAPYVGKRVRVLRYGFGHTVTVRSLVEPARDLPLGGAMVTDESGSETGFSSDGIESVRLSPLPPVVTGGEGIVCIHCEIAAPHTDRHTGLLMEHCEDCARDIADEARDYAAEARIERHPYC